MESPSRYRITEHADGFRVEGDGRPPVEVRFTPFALEGQFVGDERPGSRERFGFFNFGRLLEFVARGLMREWRPHEGWFGARDWAQEQTSRSLARRLRERWLELLARADPDVLAVQRAIFAATFGDAHLATEPALYEDRYLVQDVVRFPAAAIAVRNAHTLARELPLARLRSAPAAADLRRLAESLGARLEMKAEPIDEVSARVQVERLGDWKALFSDSGHAYRSLNRTLMNLPGRVPHRLVCELRRVHLDRPLTARLELLGVAIYAAIHAEPSGPLGENADHSRVFLHASAAQVREAVQRVAAHLGWPLDVRRARDVRQAVRFLADYPEPHRGNLSTLTERSIRWHLSMREGGVQIRGDHASPPEHEVPF